MSMTNTCKNCGNQFTGKYCNNCGERVYSVQDRSMKHLADEFLHFIFHFEGTLITTLKTFFTRPGKVSVDYCNGIRKKYFKPLSLFLLLIVIYLLFPMFEGLNMKMHYYAENKLYGEYVHNKIGYLLKHSGLTGKEIADTFHQKSEKISKFLLVLLVPLTAIFCWLCTFRKRKFFFDQMVFAAELNCFYIIWGFLILPVLIIATGHLYHWITGFYYPMNDNISGILVNVPFAAYAAIAARRFYGIKRWQSIIFALVLIWVHSFVVIQIYKFILFAITINQIH